MDQTRPLIAAARRLFETRRESEQLAGARFSSDPRWDILLYLYFASAERGITLSDLTSSGAAPETTVWRHIHALIAAGDVLQGSVETDRRKRSLRLSRNCSDGVAAILNHMCEAFATGS